jgi:hypothetical protein
MGVVVVRRRKLEEEESIETGERGKKEEVPRGSINIDMRARWNARATSTRGGRRNGMVR